ncbi:MAG: stalk domain-containing protein [Eubacteriales bacterium]|nr:stalk domain-containing protein [Eubacteriales bacterium]MDD4390817.1 stalk domain-containing protein [Eubacteriales bacterium]
MKKRTRAIYMALSIALVSNGTVFAGGSSTAVQAEAWVRPDISVEVNEQIYEFADENGDSMYPIMYKGNAYLPIRAVSGIMQEPVEWVGNARSIFIGRTITYPSKSFIKHENYFPNISKTDETASRAPIRVIVNLRNDINIFYDFERVVFKDGAGVTVYPLIYNGSTYLPLRSVSELMKSDITWDDKNKTISMGSKEKPSEEPLSENAKAISHIYDASSEIYNGVTSGIISLALMEQEEKNILAGAVSEYYDRAYRNTFEAKQLAKLEGLTEKEAQAATGVYEFSVLLEHYVLITENIVYLAAENQDYSMLADSFLNTALNMERALKEAIKQIELLSEAE